MFPPPHQDVWSDCSFPVSHLLCTSPPLCHWSETVRLDIEMVLTLTVVVLKLLVVLDVVGCHTTVLWPSEWMLSPQEKLSLPRLQLVMNALFVVVSYQPPRIVTDRVGGGVCISDVSYTGSCAVAVCSGVVVDTDGGNLASNSSPRSTFV